MAEPSVWFIVWLGIGAALTVAWAAGCVWVQRDAALILGQPQRWTFAAIFMGMISLLALLRVGPTVMPVLLLLWSVGGIGYLLYRDNKAMESERLLLKLFTREFWRDCGRSLKRKLQWSRSTGRAVSGGDAVDFVELLKKDGSSLDGSHGSDREVSKAVATIREIFESAITMRATDIHVEPKKGDEFGVRFRVDGILQNVSTLSGDEGRPAVSAVKVLSDMDIAERRRPQDGTFSARYQGRTFDVRAASGPTNFGEKIALRLLDADGGIVQGGLTGLGMAPAMLDSMRSLIQRPHGMLIVCGPTGAGKTTTLYSALSEIDSLTRNIMTIEDPIEYRLDNVSQTAVNVAAELTFAKILRSALRQDPDVILVGEIRDKETAEIAMQAALTGHFVFTTLHANDAPTTITRLLDIGIEASLIQSALTAVLAQRLVRVLCPKCREPYEPQPELLKALGIRAEKPPVFYREKGCKECFGVGFRGRTGIYELLEIGPEVRGLLVGQPSIESIRIAARKAGMKSLRIDGVRKVLAGVTTLDEVTRVTN
ncbi:MAG: type II/IV secretion system protein [Pirellulales bacterium]|jgi:type II secretory ATPase GspE/PulE/Tfp pilus assembly ATPase PilB-like protein|nr:type II/IV secretion system protein [Pirellulales bacterium]